MTSFYADSFQFISHKRDSICAFVATSHSFFHSSIIPVSMKSTQTPDDWKSVWNVPGKHSWERLCTQNLLEVFALSHTLQFSPSIILNHSDEPIETSFQHQLLTTLVQERRYLCRTLKQFGSRDPEVLDFVCKNVPTLQVLCCSNVLFTSNIALEKLVASANMLTVLDLSFCTNITDDSLACLSALTLLVKLTIDGATKITGAGFKHLSSMKVLKELNCCRCEGLTDEGFSANLPFLPSLQTLRIESYPRDFSEITLKTISRQENLKFLDMSVSLRSFSSQDGLALLSNLECLAVLDLSTCMFLDNECLRTLASLDTIATSLRALMLANCARITDMGLIEIVDKMTHLESLDVVAIPLLSDSSLEAIVELKHLRILQLSSTENMTREGMQDCFKRLSSQLQQVVFSENTNELALSDHIFECLAVMSNLEYLAMVEARSITGEGIKKLASSPSLEEIRFTRCPNITGDGISSLTQIETLRKLTVMFCRNAVTVECRKSFEGTKIDTRM